MPKNLSRSRKIRGEMKSGAKYTAAMRLIDADAEQPQPEPVMPPAPAVPNPPEWTGEAEPRWHTKDGIPVYGWGAAPEHLRTRAQLKDAGLSVPAKTPPVALLEYNRRKDPAELFDPATARPKKALTDAQKAAIEKREANRWNCPRGHQRSREDAAYDWCGPCQKEDQREASAWSAQALADPACVVMAVETTDLYGPPIRFTVTGIDGTTVLFDEVLDPGRPIDEGATRIHGKTDADVAGKPQFADVQERLAAVLSGRRVLVYSQAFVKECLEEALVRVFAEPDEWGNWPYPISVPEVGEWRKHARLHSVMRRHSAWHNNFDVGRGDYSYVPLNGPGDSLGNAAALVQVLTKMADHPEGPARH